MLNQVSDEEIYSILRIPIRLRTQKHIQTLMSITEHIKFFQKITQEYNSSMIHERCCEAMTLEEYNSSDIIINFGEVGDKFYIILKGSVFVMIPTKKKIKVKASEAYKYKNPDGQIQSSKNSDSESSEDLEAFVLPDKRERREGIPVASVSEIIKNLQTEKKSIKKSECEEAVVAKLFTNKFKKEKKNIVKIVKECDNEFIEIEVNQMVTVNTLKEGGSFGELALMSDRPRAATVMANERVSLLVIHKNSFRKILGSIASDRLLVKVKFLQSLPFFTSWTKSAIGKISVYFDVVTFQRNQTIFAEGQEAKDIFFIKEGEVLITKQQKIASGSNSLLKNQKILMKNRELRLCLKGKGESVGGYEIFNDLQYRVFGSICYSTAAEVFMIRRDNLMNRIPHIEMIREVIVVENERLDDRVKEVVAQSLDEIEKRPKTRSTSPFSGSKELVMFSAFERPSMRSFNSGKRSSKVVKSCSRKITKGEILRALNPTSLKVENKPTVFIKFKVKKNPPLNFMLRCRTGSRLKAL